MARAILDERHIHPAIRQKVGDHHTDIVAEVRAAIAGNDIVVVGMAQNPHVRRARKLLAAAGRAHAVLQYGSYLGGWRKHNALKMWTGWPTFPMVFVKGVLVGGASHLARLIESGELQEMLSGQAGSTLS